PKMVTEDFGQQPLVFAPVTVGFADADIDLEDEGPVKVVHQLDELSPMPVEQVGIAPLAEFTAGDVKLPALAQRPPEESRPVGKVGFGLRAWGRRKRADLPYYRAAERRCNTGG